MYGTGIPAVHEIGAVRSSLCTCWLWGAVEGAVQGLCSSSLRSTSGRGSSESSPAQLRAECSRAQQLAVVRFPVPVTAVTAQSPLLGVWVLSLSIAANNCTSKYTCECWDLGTKALPFQSTAGSASASKELETPQQEELGVTLPQQEGFILFEVDNEYFA